MSLVNRIERLERRVMLSGVAFTQSEVELRDLDFIDNGESIEATVLLLSGDIEDPAQIRSNLVFADLDSDGDEDVLFVAQDMDVLTVARVALYVGENKGQFQHRVSRVAPLTGQGGLPYTVALGNLNQDELLDVVIASFGVADPFEENVTLLTSVLVTGEFDHRSVLLGSGHGSGSLFIHIADVDSDEDEDIVVGSGYLTRTYLFRNEGNAVFQVDCDFNCQFVEPSWGSVIDLVDVDLDGDLDAVSDFEGIARWIENTDGLQVGSEIHFIGDGELDGEWVFGDFDRDGDVDAWGRNQNTLFESNAAALRSDLDNDGVVGFSDFLEFSARFGLESETPSQSNVDINSDGSIDLEDFGIFAANFGKST